MDGDQERQLRLMTGEYMEHEKFERNIGELEVSSIFIPPVISDQTRFFVFLSLLNGDERVLIKALVDTGSMGCFIHSKIVNTNNLQTKCLSSPITCSGFDDTPGKDVVDKEWNGTGRFCFGQSVSNDFSFDLLVNKIGSYDMILGMPWLERNEAKIFCRTGATCMELATLHLEVEPMYQDKARDHGVDIIPVIDDSRRDRSAPIIPLVNEKELLPFSPDLQKISIFFGRFSTSISLFTTSSEV